MNPTQRYLFDLQGFLHLPGLLTRDETQRLLTATKQLEEDALACRAESKKWKSVWGPEYWQNQRHGYFAFGDRAHGQTLMVEDFWLYPDAFDMLIGHGPTRAIVAGAVASPYSINNSEIRIRYPGNLTGRHMGYPTNRDSKYRYGVVDGQIRCMMVRMIYFLHDVSGDEGVTCFVPGSHLSNLPMPLQGCAVDQEPGVVGINVKAGDGIFFTESCRHGGFPNKSEATRYTLHVGYGPEFLPSQNISTMDELPHVTEALLARLTAEQRRMLVRRVRQGM